MDPTIRKHIESADWPTITRKLARYASNCVSKIFYGVWSDDSVLPMGYSVNAIVHEAIEDLLNGKRKWKPENVDLLGFLMGVVRSKTNHLVELKENNLTDRTKILEERDDLQDDRLNPEQLLVNKETNELFSKVYQRLLEQAEESPEHEGVVLCIMEGIVKPADIAKETGIDINKVYYLKKHWQKNFEKYLQEVLAEAN